MAGREDAYCRACGARLEHFTIGWRHTAYLRIFVVGLILYYVDKFLLGLSGNPNLVPTVILLGAWLVPVTYVAFLYDNEALQDIPLPTIALTFFFGGVVATAAAGTLEMALVKNEGILGFLLVGLCEEIAKPLAVVWVARRREYFSELHGLVLGAAAGMGFAAFETMGYGFTAVLSCVAQEQHGCLSLLAETLRDRGLLAPFGHGTWTAIVCAVLWRERARVGHFVLNRSVGKAFLAAVLLHAAWDITAGIPLEIYLPYVVLPLLPLIVGVISLGILYRLMREASGRVAQAVFK